MEALLLALFVVVFGVSVVRVSGDSMEPSLRSGEWALVPRYETWLHRIGLGRFERGDIVFFRSPLTDGGPFGPFLIKRAVAVQGDVVAMRGGQLILNGRTLEEAHLKAGPRGFGSMASEVVPENHVFVLGDNRAPLGSVDSRRFGPIPNAAIAGRAAVVIWPLFRRTDEALRWNPRWLRRPAAFSTLDRDTWGPVVLAR